MPWLRRQCWRRWTICRRAASCDATRARRAAARQLAATRSRCVSFRLRLSLAQLPPQPAGERFLEALPSGSAHVGAAYDPADEAARAFHAKAVELGFPEEELNFPFGKARELYLKEAPVVPSKSNSGFKGVYVMTDRSRAKRFKVRIGHKGAKINCGTHDTAEAAARAYDAKARELGIAEEWLNYPHGQPRTAAAPIRAAKQPIANTPQAPKTAKRPRRGAGPDAASAPPPMPSLEGIDWDAELASADLPRLRSLAALADDCAAAREAALSQATAHLAEIEAALQELDAAQAHDEATAVRLRINLRAKRVHEAAAAAAEAAAANDRATELAARAAALQAAAAAAFDGE